MKNTIKQYLIIVIGLILLTSCEKKVDWDKESNMFKISNRKLYYNGELYSGIITNFEDGGRFPVKYTTSSWKEGIPNGYWESVHKNGKIREIMNYKNGLRDGTYEYFNRDGVSLEKLEYEDGEFSGEKTELFKNGGKRIKRYLKSKLHGKIESYYSNGSVGERVTFDNGNISSDYEVFYIDGNVMCRMERINRKKTYFKKDGTPVEDLFELSSEIRNSPEEYFLREESRKFR